MHLSVFDMPTVAEAKGKTSINLMGLGSLIDPSSAWNLRKRSLWTTDWLS